jgi:hypothetical protein
MRRAKSSALPRKVSRWKAALNATIFGLFLLSTAASAIATSSDDLPTFLLVMKNSQLYPATINVPANTKFRLEIRNEGPGAAEFESLDLHKETVLAPGTTRKLVFHPMQPGTYQFVDEFHAATAQGQIVAK